MRGAIKQFFNRIRRASWSYKQPLTLSPAVAGVPVSDLFVWRNSADWETFFELTDLPGLFTGSDNAENMVTLMFFDETGLLFLEKTIVTQSNKRNTLDLNQFIDGKHGDAGTFSVFHGCKPKKIGELGSYLSERGYVSYRYKGGVLRSYVHGNYDAIARLPDQTLQLLGGTGLRRREYHLQLALVNGSTYQLSIVNHAAKTQRISCKMLSSKGGILDSQAIDLTPRGVHFFKLKPQHDGHRVVIISQLIMARPIVFQIQNQTVDVFHG